MGFGTSFTADIYLNRQIFDSRWELDQKVVELEGYIQLAKEELIALAVSTPRDAIAEKDESGYPQNPIEEVLRKTRETIQWMEDNYRELNKLYQFQEYLDENPDVELGKLNDLN